MPLLRVSPYRPAAMNSAAPSGLTHESSRSHAQAVQKSLAPTGASTHESRCQRIINGSFSIRRVWVKHLRAISITLVFDVDRGLSLLFGIGTAALPSWDQKSGAVQSDSRPDSGLAVDPGPIANSPHPSSREGHLPTSGGSLLLSGFYQISAAPSRDQRNSLPSIHILCMMTAMRRAKATTAFFKPPRLATVMAQAFSHDHFFTRVSMDCAAS